MAAPESDFISAIKKQCKTEPSFFSVIFTVKGPMTKLKSVPKTSSASSKPQLRYYTQKGSYECSSEKKDKKNPPPLFFGLGGQHESDHPGVLGEVAPVSLICRAELSGS